ncbi:MAG: hypothetical protein PWQ92_1443 [Thermococcaceae archaeon]|nr:hypothetical protein [Thermococcaceae archaeon]
MKNNPGPLAPTTLPSLKITALSYSFTIFIAEDKNTKTKTKITTYTIHSKAILLHLISIFPFILFLFFPNHDKFESIHFNNLNLLADMY